VVLQSAAFRISIVFQVAVVMVAVGHTFA
jgi:hypothetical protein